MGLTLFGVAACGRSDEERASALCNDWEWDGGLTGEANLDAYSAVYDTLDSDGTVDLEGMAREMCPGHFDEYDQAAEAHLAQLREEYGVEDLDVPDQETVERAASIICTRLIYGWTETEVVHGLMESVGQSPGHSEHYARDYLRQAVALECPLYNHTFSQNDHRQWANFVVCQTDADGGVYMPAWAQHWLAYEGFASNEEAALPLAQEMLALCPPS